VRRRRPLLQLPFPLWVISGAAGVALLPLALVLDPPARGIAFGVGAPLLLLWAISGFRSGRFRGGSGKSDLRDRARERRERPPADDSEPLDSRRDRSRRIRKFPRWRRRYEFPHAEDHDPS
jgi:hypothetical protein